MEIVAKGTNMTDVKRRNRASILRLIYSTGGMSRKDIARQLKLTPAAITVLTNEMINEGLLEETGEEHSPGRAGRREIIVDICCRKYHAVGININLDHTVVTCLDLKGGTLFEDRFRTDNSSTPEQFARYVWEVIEDNLRAIKKDNIVGLGVGVRGIVDSRWGISLESYGLWDEQVNVKEIFTELTRLPVGVDNNVRNIARGQLFFAQDKPRSFLLVKYGPGIGGALMVQEGLFTGHNYRAIELGHVVVEEQGALCRCNKRGCLETISSYYAIEAAVRAVYSLERTPVLYEATGGETDNIDLEAIMQAYRGGDEPVVEIVSKAMRLFALVLKNVITLLDPEKVFLYGVAFEHEDFLQLVYDFMQDCTRAADVKNLVVKSELNGQLSSKGPASLAIQNFFDSGGVVVYPSSLRFGE